MQSIDNDNDAKPIPHDTMPINCPFVIINAMCSTMRNWFSKIAELNCLVELNGLYL